MIAWLWARTVTSPNPAVNAPVPLVRSFVLSKKKGRECWAKPKVEGTTVRFEVTPGKPPAGEDGTVKRTGARCIISGEPMGFDYVRAEGKAGRMGAQLMAIVTEGKRGRSYYSPDAEHARIAESAEPKWKPVGDVPEQALGFRVQLYGMDEYHKLFTPRQLTALTTFSDLVHEARELVTRDALASTPLGPPNELGGGLNVEDDRPLREGGQGARAYGEALQAYLGMALSRVVMGCNSLSRWNSFGQKVQHCFGRQALPMIWDFADPNPFTESTGSWSSGFKYVADPLERGGISPQARATVFQEDATALRIADKLLLSTDPPYYDNIGYADLSDMFYVWMRRTIREVYPDLFSTMLTPKSSELIASAHRHESKECATTSFEDGMRWTLQQARGLVVLDYPATVYYAFKQQDIGSNGSGASSGWETMLASLISGGFSIVGSWPIRTEMRTRLVGRGTNALASSIVLVCRPRPEDAPAISRRRFLDALRAELPGAIAEMKTGSIAPVDMAQATIGPGMAIFSRYSQVLEADGAPLTVRMALGLINAALDEVLEGAVTELDAETRFAVSWFEQYAFEKGDFGGANTIAQGKNTAVDSVERAGLVEATGGQVRLINWREYDPGAYEPEQDKRPTVWEGAHHLIERLNHHGEMGAAALYNRLPGDIAESARDLAYRLYHICDRKGWAEDALDYNVLVSSWSEITRLAASGRNRGDQADMFDDS